MGNVTAETTGTGAELDRRSGANLTSLGRFFDTSRYLRGTSDIVALMVLEHQTAVHNALTEAAFRTRIAVHRQRALSEETGQAVPDGLAGSALSVARSQAAHLVEHLLFCNEAPLPYGGIDGDGQFESAFREHRQVAADGRSLKDFQLLDRLFKYRCSYMVYSTAFDALGPELKSLVYQRLLDVLTAQDPEPEFAHLGDGERRHILRILADTLDDLPPAWHAQVSPATPR
jgi:hypothetical protein